MSNLATTKLSAFYAHLLNNQNKVLLISFVVTVLLATGITKLQKDTTVDAFVPSDHPSVVSRDAIRATFGLQDPIVLSISANKGNAFTPAVLNRLFTLHKQIEAIPEVRQGGVKSLVSESHISSNNDELIVQALLREPVDAAQAQDIQVLATQMPPFQGTLVAFDQSAVAIIAELIDQQDADLVYGKIQALINEPHPEYEIYLAGQGAVGGYLSKYIDTDARKLQPVIFVVVLAMLWLAFRQTKSLLAPLAVIIPSALGTIGTMAWLQVPYYAITSALPVIVTAIAVADSIHILTAYYKLKAKYPNSSQQDLVSRAVVSMFKPVTYTTLTTIAGFVGLSLASIMPPVSAFGAFAALGVLLAWVYSVIVLPCILVKLKLKQSTVFTEQKPTSNLLGDKLTQLAIASTAKPLLTICVLISVLALGVVSASHLRVDRAQINNFNSSEAIVHAHNHLNQKYAGTAYLDIVLTSSEVDGLLEQNNLQKVAKLQAFLLEQPHVSKSLAINDYLQQLHLALIEPQDSKALPNDADTLAQYLLLYESSSSNADFSDEIDNQYQQMLIRAYMNSDLYSQERPVVEAVEQYLSANFNNADISYSLGGRVNVDYHWMTRLKDSNMFSIAVSLSLVLIFACILFKSIPLGVVATLPVVFAVVVVYAVMAEFGITLEPATSMFAAIAIGVGIDFSIHFIARLQKQSESESFTDTMRQYFPAAARACFFNAAALGLGFATLMISSLPTLQRFGLMITLACFVSFVAALFIVPIALRIKANGKHSAKTVAPVLSCVLLVVVMGVHNTAKANDKDGLWVAKQVWQRADGERVKRELVMQLTDRNGNMRERKAEVLRLRQNEVKKTRIRFSAPRRVKHTGFLSYDFLAEDQQDEQWIFLPAIKKTRRIPISGRGESFMGSDFSYEEIKSNFKFALNDYHFVLTGQTEDHYLLQATPVNQQVAEELGIGKLDAQIDKQTWLPMQVRFYDTRMQALKNMTIDKVEQKDGIYVVMQVTMQHQQNQHKSVFSYTDVSFLDALPEREFGVSKLAQKR